MNEEDNKDKLVYILYHENCLDGWASAYLAYRLYRDMGIQQIVLQPINYGGRESEVIGTIYDDIDAHIDEIMFVDFCPTQLTIDSLVSPAMNVGNIVVLDHHVGQCHLMAKYAEEYTNVHAEYSETLSGVGLVWRHWMEQRNASEQVKLPRMFAAVQDRDLWQFKLAYTKEICEALYCQSLNPWTVAHWDELYDSPTESLGNLINIGKTLLTYKENAYEQIMKNAYPMCLAYRDDDGVPTTITGLAVNAPYEYASEIGHRLAEQCGSFGLVWNYNGREGLAHCSIRGTNMDVLPIAKQAGGGGHAKAAGFTMTLIELANCAV